MPQLDTIIIADQVSLVIISFVGILVIIGIFLLPVIRLRILCYSYLNTNISEYSYSVYFIELVGRLSQRQLWSGVQIK
jgi:hypothetical protein